MSDQKLPLHQVLFNKINLATVGVTKNYKANPFVIRELLDTLSRGKLKAVDAHKIADDLAGLPKLFKSADQSNLAEFAEEVLNDLRGREDEEIQESQERVSSPLIHPDD